jgi:PEP-CTERM motif-containing protein
MSNSKIGAGAALCLLASSLMGGTIGPDSFGYTGSNTAQVFSYVDISGTGTRVLANDDDNTVSANIGFNFNFYGTSYSNLFISSNGLLTFGSANSAFSAANFATTAPSGNTPAIAVLWDDWDTVKSSYPTSDAVYYQTLGSAGSRSFVIQWHNTFPCCPSGNQGLDFEAILYESSNNILFQYSNTIGGAGLQTGAGNNGDCGSTAGVGIRDTSGQTNGRNLQWSFAPGTTTITNGETIFFSTGAASGVPEPGTLSLVGVGAITLLALRRRSKRQSSVT